jgi:hypothetical protein
MGCSRDRPLKSWRTLNRKQKHRRNWKNTDTRDDPLHGVLRKTEMPLNSLVPRAAI